MTKVVGVIPNIRLQKYCAFCLDHALPVPLSLSAFAPGDTGSSKFGVCGGR